MPNRSHSTTRTARLSRVIAILTRNYLARARSGRPTANLLARVRPISDAYLTAINAERDAR